MRTALATALGLCLIGAAWSLAERPAALRPRDAGASSPLRRVLQQYGIPEASQVLVFSKTSLQRDRIDEDTPRALYFNERAAVGWVPGSPLLELAVFDGRTPGVSFLTMDTSRGGEEAVSRGDQCFQCHALPDAGGMQGLLMRSAGLRRTKEAHRCFEEIDDRTPYDLRWGGWYVTGARIPHGHGGREQLPALAADYGRPGSDVVALLVLGHEVTAVNLISRLAREARLAEQDAKDGRAPDLAAFRTRVNELTDYLLFLEETPLPAPVAGDPAYVRAFEAAGVRDAHGHSLRTLDLQRRLFRVPCSFMIHSPAFAGLPESARHAVYARMSELLAGAPDPRVRERLTQADREAIVHVLRATLADLPADFGRPTSAS